MANWAAGPVALPGMRIAIYHSPGTPAHDTWNWYTRHLLQAWQAACPQHDWVPVGSDRQTATGLAARLAHGFRVRRQLARLKPHLLVVAGGRPPAGNLPKIWLHGSGVAGKRQPKGTQAVVMPCYAANATKAAGRHHTPVLASGWGLDDMPGPVDRSQRQLVQEGVSDGFEYFLYAGPVQDTDILVNLLKAYSLFKKRQQSSMKLLIANTGHGSMQALRHMLETYKYRQDVLLSRPGSWQEALPLVGAAYALVDPRPQPELPLLWTAAWKAGVPLLCQKQSLPLLADGEPALTFQGAEPQAMAPALMQIYKDENMRSWLAQQGMEQASSWTWPQAVQQLEALLQQPMG